jgi:hypothetical protein
MPTITSLCMDSGMARLTQGDEIISCMCAAFRKRDAMVDLFRRNKQTFLLTQLAQRMLLHIAVSDTLPSTAITTAYSRVSVVLLVAFVLLLLMFRTKPAIRKLWTAGIGTRSLRFLRHRFTSFVGIEKALRDCSHKARS